MSKELQMAALRNRYHKMATNGRNQGETGPMRKIKRKLRNLEKDNK